MLVHCFYWNMEQISITSKSTRAVCAVNAVLKQAENAAELPKILQSKVLTLPLSERGLFVYFYAISFAFLSQFFLPMICCTTLRHVPNVSCALRQMQLFPRLAPAACFPALGTRCKFSRAC